MLNYENTIYPIYIVKTLQVQSLIKLKSIITITWIKLFYLSAEWQAITLNEKYMFDWAETPLEMNIPKTQFLTLVYFGTGDYMFQLIVDASGVSY